MAVLPSGVRLDWYHEQSWLKVEGMISPRNSLRRLLMLIVWSGLFSPVFATAGDAVRLEIKGAIGPATADYIAKGIAHAQDQNATLIVLEMDTPGGLDSAMRAIIKDILASPIPVVTYVSPEGSRAASAGTYILYASHVAAMAPATNLGAATPVQIGGGGSPLPGQQPAPEDTEQTSDGNGKNEQAATDSESAEPALEGTAMERKAINDAVAYIRGLAEMRGRNADWAERAVREAASLSAEQAQAQNVIDLVAESIDELLTAIDQRSVRVNDKDMVLETADLELESFEPDWRTKLLAVITDPTVAYMLMLAGIYGLLFEGYNPGALVPGVVGAICILLALYAFQVLPVNYAGLALILLGLVLMISEAFVPSFGALGLGGVVAFVFGSIILFDHEVPGFQVARSLIISIAAVASLLLLGLLTMFARMRLRPVVTGMEEMIGSIGEAMEDFVGDGRIFVHGERWQAQTEVAIRKGDAVKVTRVDGLTLGVEPVAADQAKQN